jgi:hypothetical protein
LLLLKSLEAIPGNREDTRKLVWRKARHDNQSLVFVPAQCSGSSLDIIILLKFIFSSYILILIYLRTFLRKKIYFPHKIGKIGPWRSLRILRFFSAKVDFPRFMYCFGRFSAFTQNLSASRSQQVHYILKKALIL